MSTRKTIVFKLNNEIVCEEPKDLKDECIEDSELDSTPDGLVFWKSTFFTPVVGVECSLVVGSDEYLDAMLDGTLEKYLKFSIEKFVYTK